MSRLALSRRGAPISSTAKPKARFNSGSARLPAQSHVGRTQLYFACTERTLSPVCEQSKFRIEGPGSMDTRKHRPSASAVQELRRAGGEWLRKLREQRGLSQRELAKRVDANYYTFISQLETGRGRIPPDRYRVWAQALDIDAKLFVKTLLQYYDPITHAVLFPDERSTTLASEQEIRRDGQVDVRRG